MSVRLLAHRLFRNGRWIFQNFCKRDIHTNIFDRTVKDQPKAASLRKAVAQTKHIQPAIRNTALFRFGQNARRLFVDNILNRVTTTYSQDLRTEAAKKFFNGDSGPFFALVGVGLASGSGILTKDDELEGVCWEIREAITRLQNKREAEENTKFLDENFGLDDLNIGPPIAKGCAAVVYAASFKQPDAVDKENIPKAELPMSPKSVPVRHEMMSPIQQTSRFVHNFGGSVDNLYFNRNDLFESNASTPISPSTPSRRDSIDEESDSPGLKKSVRFNTAMNVLYEEQSHESSTTSTSTSAESFYDASAKTDIETYPLALKMMFNYDIQSNAMSILRAMYKETIPARSKQFNKTTDNWEKLLMEQTVSLPAHPNIVNMFGVFCAQVPNLLHSSTMYPMALPPRLNPQGYGRNMSLFLVMKRYSQNLSDYLYTNVLPMRTKLLLFAQLLEAVAHLYRYGVAHRDLKSDNILIEANDEFCPTLVVSDFGCCLADKVNGLVLPYTTGDIDKGGNTALMAPEIINQSPGTFSFLNYTKSDLWACGSIAYEIFGTGNPFFQPLQANESDFTEGTVKALRNVTYADSDLPPLNEDVPLIVQKLIYNILQKNPSKRLSPDTAANVMQLFLWAPSTWLKRERKPDSAELLQWLLSLTTKVLCEGRPITGNLDLGRRTYTEFVLISSFLVRAHLQRIRYALNWIHNVE